MVMRKRRKKRRLRPLAVAAALLLAAVLLVFGIYLLLSPATVPAEPAPSVRAETVRMPEAGATEALVPVSSHKELINEDDTVLVQRLFVSWLDQYVSRSPDESGKLYEYADLDVKPLPVADNAKDVKIIYRVSYSLRLTAEGPLPDENTAGQWLAGNGLLDDDGWIRDKSLYVELVKGDGDPYLLILGTGLS